MRKKKVVKRLRLPKLNKPPRSHAAKVSTGLAIVQGVIGAITAIWNAKRSRLLHR